MPLSALTDPETGRIDAIQLLANPPDISRKIITAALWALRRYGLESEQDDVGPVLDFE